MLVKDVIDYLKRCDPTATVVFLADNEETVVECIEHNIRSNTVCFYDALPNWRIRSKNAEIEIQVLFVETTYTEL